MMRWLKSLHNYCNKREWILFLIILVLVLRLPSFIMPHYYGDEEIYFVMGRAWANGLPLYKAMFDHKPPLIYILAGIAPTMLSFRVVLALVMIIHTVLFYKLAELFWAKTRPFLTYVSSLIFVVLTTLPTFEGLTVNAELLMMMPVTAAAVILWKTQTDTRVRPYNFLFAGLLGGIAWLFKIPVAFDMMALGLYFFVFKQKTIKEAVAWVLSWSFLAYAFAFVAPLALTFVYYYLKGTGPDYLATVVSVNLGYVSSWSTSTYTFNPLKSGLVVRGTILLVCTFLLYVARKKLDKRLVFASLWVIFSLFGALLSARPYPHYLQELMAPLALLLPFIFVAEKVMSWIVIAVIVLLGGLTQYQIKFWGYPTISVYKTYIEYVTGKISWTTYLNRFDNATRNYKIASYLNERMTEKDQIFNWGTDATIYNLTNRLPSGGKYIVSFHIRDLNKYEYVMEQLEINKPKYILIQPGSGEFLALTALLDHQYALAKVIDDVEIYIRL